MFWYFGKSKKISSAGFTILELIVVLTIFMIITAVVISDIPNFRDKSSLELRASEIATYIRGAQNYSLAKKIGSNSSVDYYQICFDLVNPSVFYLRPILIGGSVPLCMGLPSGQYEEKYEIAGYKLDLSPNSKIINFEGSSGNGIGTNLTPKFSPQLESGNKLQIKITKISNPNESKCVYVFPNGQITIGNCE